MLKIAVIGTAGRGEDFDRLSPHDFGSMCTMVHTCIHNITKEPYLVSGGAAWADHIAVNLYNLGIVDYLDLHLPAKWDYATGKYEDVQREINHPGRISNYHHQRFSNKVGIDSFAELDRALQRAKHTVSNGFFKRNSDVAKAQAVIALTFGDKEKLKDGGTANTFRKYLDHTAKNVSFHIDLNDWKVYTPATL